MEQIKILNDVLNAHKLKNYNLVMSGNNIMGSKPKKDEKEKVLKKKKQSK